MPPLITVRALHLALSVALLASLASLVVARPASAGSIGVGRQATCALRSGGTVACWGRALRLGIASGAASPTPVTVDGISSATDVDAGTDHACAVLSDGTVRCWGNNDSLQLGFPDTVLDPFAGVSNASAPVTARESPAADAPAIPDAKAVSAGSQHTCAIRAAGTVKCWGNAGNGRLGNGNGNGITDVVSISAGAFATCAVRFSGSVSCWGAGGPASPPAISDAVAVAAGSGSACALRATGRVTCWGSIAGDVAGIDDATQIAAGSGNACARRAGGTVSCWGTGYNGQPNAEVTSNPTPVTVAGLSDATEVSLGNADGCAIRASGGVACWGENGDGQLGNNVSPNSATPVTATTGATSVATGGASVCAVMTDATGKCWGYNGNGQIGDGTKVTRPSPTPVAGLSDLAQFALGDAHTCARRTTDAKVLCWGSNKRLQLGSFDLSAPNPPDYPTPTVVPGVTASRISAGIEHTCAVVPGGTPKVSCWGTRWFPTSPGTGSGHFEFQLPTPVDGTENATDVVSLEHTDCALISDNAVKCWGTGDNGARGQPGEGLDPAAVPGVAATAIKAVGAQAVCALLVGGGVKCWGRGPNAEDWSAGPTAIATIPNGDQCTLSGSTVSCVGNGGTGTLGDGYQPTGHYPVQPVPGDVVGIADARQPPAPTLSPSDVSLAPTAIDFPQTAVGPTSDPLAVTITNVSDHAVPLFLSTPAPTPESEFGSGGTTCGGSLARGAACTVSYVFHPTSGGTKLGTATIRVANAEHTISLTGAGLTGFVVTPQKLTFAKTKVGAVSAGQAVTIVNASGITRPLNLSVTGLGNDFRASNGCGTTLGVGATCTVTFAFAPTAGGTRTANPAISLAGTANPIALAGVGFVDNAFTFRSAKASKGKLALALVFPGPGRVSVAAITKVKTKVKGKVRIKTVTYGSLRNVSVRKGSKSLSVSPSKTGAALLKRAKRLQLTVKVTFTPTGGTAAARSRTVTATLK